MTKMVRLCALAGAIALGTLGGAARPAAAQAVIREGTGQLATDIQSVVDAFRADLGTLAPNGPTTGDANRRREVNWDGVPDNLSSGGGAFPGDFFNQADGSAAGRIRGIQFATTIGTLEVSADGDSDNNGSPGPVATLFGNHLSENADDFAAFSAERIFGLVGTNQLDVTFSVSGTPGTSGLVRGFGAVFTDVELAGGSKLDFYDANDVLLLTREVAASAFSGADSFKSFSFVGASFPTAVVARVHITAGGYDLNLQQFGADDAIAMDDFIYGEPVAVPEPGALALGGMALVALAGWRRRRVA
jgi:hypothetical protein